MGSRLSGEGPTKVYAAAQEWMDAALRSDDSLFTPGTPVWTASVLTELREKFLDTPDTSSNSFTAKLERQLAGASPEAYQLMGEALYIHLLIGHKSFMAGPTKQRLINQVIRWSGRTVPIPEALAYALASGMIHPGQGFHNYRPFQVGYVIELSEQWKQTPESKQEGVLEDPWAFKSFLIAVQPKGQMFKEAPNAHRMQQDALLHLVFPDTFEAINSVTHKRMIAEAFKEHIKEPTQDIDRQLEQIRPHLEAQFGIFGYYDRARIRPLWDPRFSFNSWDTFVRSAREYVDSGKLEEEETNYKLQISRQLSEAREAVRKAGEPGDMDWRGPLAKGLAARPGGLMNWRNVQKLNNWCREDPTAALGALQAVWSQDTDSVVERIRNFCSLLPASKIGGAGIRTNVASVLLMGLNAAQYPPFMTTVFDKAYTLTEYEKPAVNANEAELYDHALNFLDRFIGEAGNRGLAIQNRLDAQSLIWAVVTNPGDGNGNDDGDWEDEEDRPQLTLEALADELLLTAKFLREIKTLLEDKKQVIFQGPPGTGKTYVARALARHLANNDAERVTLVQFHPSYAYEDFVQGFRPKRDGDGFELRDGPLLRAAQAAQNDPTNDHYLIIDEINRGNLGKVFGELYFLLEYRDEAMRLQYADKDFSLPQNLYIVGTMNTADRSIALVDLALRRRFSFIDFHPDEEPVKGVLQRWLATNAPKMEWVAKLVEAANDKLKDDRHAAIGPSYFIKPGLDEAAVERIWKHNVLPYLQERLYEQEDALNDFQLSAFEAYHSRHGEVSSENGDGSAPSGMQQDGGDDTADHNGQSGE